jgi:hypothetical protein
VPPDRDFVIELDGRSGSYRLHVSSPAGDASVDVGLDPAQLGVDLDALQTRVLASATRSRALVPELERPLRQAGQALFQAVFPASAGALFLSSRNEVEQAGGRLRILLRLHPPELAVLPWELLFSHDFGGYLCRPVRNIGTETGANDDLSLVQARKPAVARGRPVRSLGSQRMRRSRI